MHSAREAGGVRAECEEKGKLEGWKGRRHSRQRLSGRKRARVGGMTEAWHQVPVWHTYVEFLVLCRQLQAQREGQVWLEYHVHVCASVSVHVEMTLEEHKIALKVRLFIPYISNTQETEAGGHEFHSSKGYIARSCLKKYNIMLNLD